MIKQRLIAVIVVRDGGVVQSEKFKHNHVIHYDAIHAVDFFSRWDVDEIILLNVSRDRKTRAEFANIVEHVSKKCWVPLTAGGWIDHEDYGVELIRRGADKLIINTAFYSDVSVPRNLSERLGKQCIVASIDINIDDNNQKLVWVDRGTQSTGRSLRDWIIQCEANGAGELFINNIQHDGNRQGYDIDSLLTAVSVTKLPIIIFGGAYHNKDFADGLCNGASAVAAANIFHYKEMATKQVKRYLKRNNFNVRSQ